MVIAELSPKRYWWGPVSQEVAEKRLYLTPHGHHHNDSCITKGSDESHFKVWLIVRGKVTKTVPINHNF